MARTWPGESSSTKGSWMPVVKKKPIICEISLWGANIHDKKILKAPKLRVVFSYDGGLQIKIIWLFSFTIHQPLKSARLHGVVAPAVHQVAVGKYYCLDRLRWPSATKRPLEPRQHRRRRSEEGKSCWWVMSGVKPPPRGGGGRVGGWTQSKNLVISYWKTHTKMGIKNRLHEWEANC